MFSYFSNKFLNLEFIKYLFAGAVSNVLGFVLFFILASEIFKINPVKVVIFLSPLIFLLHYILQNFYVFKKKFNKNYFFKYLILYLINYLLNVIFLYLLVNKFFINHNLAQILILIFLTIYTFLISKYLVFK